MDAHTLEIESAEGAPPASRGEHILIACGTRPAHNATVPLDGKRIIDSDQLLKGETLPQDLIVVGAGVIGLEYASMISALNIKVTVIEARPTVLDFVDREMIDSLMYFMRQRGAAFRLGEKVERVGYDEKGRVVAFLESGKEIHGDTLLYTVGRQRQRRPAQPRRRRHRGRRARQGRRQRVLPDRGPAHLRGRRRHRLPRARLDVHGAGPPGELPHVRHVLREQQKAIPYGIYTIPEISMVGKTEQELTAERVPYEIGVSKFEELAKGQMLGVDTGMLKLLFDRNTRKLLGVHIFGERATEIIHIGQAVIAFGGTIDYFRDTVFNYPTMAEAYKVAGLDGLNRL